MTNDEMKDWIANASYKQLLQKWRFASPGDPFFVGEVGEYYTTVMNSKKRALAPGEAVRASKELGWKR
jgi:hypothetical protein